MSNCKCEYVEEVNAIQSGVRIHKLVKRCEECEEAAKQAREQDRLRRIDVLKEQIKLLEVDVQSAKTLGYDDVAQKKQELVDEFKKQLDILEKPEVVEDQPKKRGRPKKNGNT